MLHPSFDGSRLLRLACLAALVVGSAPSADAQFGRLLDRARDAVSSAGEQARGALDRPPAQADGAPAPAIDYADLLDTRFFPARGVFELDAIVLAFPPAGLGERESIRAEYLVRDASGRVLSRQRLGHADVGHSGAFAQLETTAGVAGDGETAVRAGGSYTLDVELYGDLVGSVPFTVTESSNGDPFNPVTTMRLEGPWRTHAYFLHKTDRPGDGTSFNAWIRPDEVAEYERNGYTKVEVSIRRDGREVAWGTTTVYMTHYAEWGLHASNLFTPGSRNANGRFGTASRRPINWTIQDVTPGAYEIVLSTEADGPFRTFTITGADGAFVPHPRSAIDYEPRAHFLTQRHLSDSRLSTQNSVYWIAPME